MNNSQASLKHEYDFCPETGEAIEILPGLKWLRLPLPFMLGHVNVWLLKDGETWVIVDTGIYSKPTRAVWQDVFTHCLDNAPVSRVLVTHMHPDHVG